MEAATTATGGSDSDRRRLQLRHAMAGLEAGVLGGLFLLGCLMIGSLFDGRSIWSTPNLFATTFFGGSVFRNHFVRVSWTGVALIIALYGGLGVLWGCLWRERRPPFMALYGALLGIAIYFFFFDFAWKQVNPLIAAYAPTRALQVGHVLWGIILARSPLYARRIVQSVSPAAPAAQPETQEVAEIRSGEVIR